MTFERNKRVYFVFETYSIFSLSSTPFDENKDKDSCMSLFELFKDNLYSPKDSKEML